MASPRILKKKKTTDGKPNIKPTTSPTDGSKPNNHQKLQLDVLPRLPDRSSSVPHLATMPDDAAAPQLFPSLWLSQFLCSLSKEGRMKVKKWYYEIIASDSLSLSLRLWTVIVICLLLLPSLLYKFLLLFALFLELSIGIGEIN